jgi:hypothetical protein
MEGRGGGKVQGVADPKKLECSELQSPVLHFVVVVVVAAAVVAAAVVAAAVVVVSAAAAVVVLVLAAVVERYLRWPLDSWAVLVVAWGSRIGSRCKGKLSGRRCSH